ncbi:MAG: PadR family transcriptional regulator [Pseudomonadota bacterium]
MNISTFVVLGALESLGTASGYDIIRFLDRKKISRWTGIKGGSVYHSMKSMEKKGDIKKVNRVKNGLFPTMTLYEITDQGRTTFDNLQHQAFLGLYPLYFGFKLALKFNKRRTHEEIRQAALAAIDVIDRTMGEMDNHLKRLSDSDPRKASDVFFIEHDRMLLQEEKRWIRMVVEKLTAVPQGCIDGL